MENRKAFVHRFKIYCALKSNFDHRYALSSSYHRCFFISIITVVDLNIVTHTTCALLLLTFCIMKKNHRGEGMRYVRQSGRLFVEFIYHARREI